MPTRQVVYKYKLATIPQVIGRSQTVKLPELANVISAAMQHGTLVVWAIFDMVNLDKITTRDFVVAFTGPPIEPPEGFFSEAYINSKR